MNSATSESFDIAIVGGGMVGLTAALAYSQLGFTVALIEAVSPDSEASGAFDQRAVALSSSSVAIYQSLGLWPLIQRYATPIHHIHVSDRGHFGRTRLAADDHQVDALGQVITLEQIGPLLWQKIADSEMIKTLCPCSIRQIEHMPDRCRLTLAQNNRSQTKNSSQYKTANLVVEAKLVLASDGTFSSMAERCGITVERKPYLQHAVIANIQTQLPHQNRAFERFTQAGPLALLPLSRNQLGMVWCQTPEQAKINMALSEKAFCEALQATFCYQLGRISRVSQRASYPLSLHLAERQFEQRVLLLGNSAHTLHPIAGQGLNLALRDIASLNDCLREAELDNQDIGAPDLLAKYSESRLADWQQTIVATDTLTRLFSQDFLPINSLRNAAMLGINLLPPIKSQLARAAMGTNLKSSRLARGLENQPLKARVDLHSPATNNRY